ncbi:MAG: cell wall-binding repeat-containing protein [Actinomycetales bacterium]|nr:cell wall-binding repeat-containing protein [Candidatus Phosphoribacter baldrii]
MSFKTPRIAAAVLTAAALLAAPAASAYAWGPDGDDTAVPLDVDGRTYVAGDGPTVLRIAGPDRIATAIKAFCATESWRGHHDGGDSDRLILAASDDDKYADALASGPLADLLDAPTPGHPQRRQAWTRGSSACLCSAAMALWAAAMTGRSTR